MFQLDIKSRLPLYEQLIEKIKELIIKGILKKDEKLPSVRSLATSLTVNPNTIQKSYKELERQGYIYSIKGKGNFVSGNITSINKEEISNIKENIKKYIKKGAFLGIDKKEIEDIIEKIYSK